MPFTMNFDIIGIAPTVLLWLSYTDIQLHYSAVCSMNNDF